jgi:amphi-Trp domain-containing protein
LAAAYLESLARGLRDGHITIEAESQLIESAVGEEVSIELEAESNSKGRFTLSIDLDWRLRRSEAVPPMVISSYAPRPVQDTAPSDAGQTGFAPE